MEEAFNITGRGTGVTGTMSGAFTSAGQPAELQVGGLVKRLDKVYLEVTRQPGGEERMALMLYGASKEEVPPGSTIRGPVA